MWCLWSVVGVMSAGGRVESRVRCDEVSPRPSPRLCGAAPSSGWTSAAHPGSVSWGFPPDPSSPLRTQTDATPALTQTNQPTLVTHTHTTDTSFLFGARQSLQ